MKLNLGCGDKKLDGYVNVDLYGSPDLQVDLFKFPWRWNNESIDEVAAIDFLEHVENFRHTWHEIYRILKPGGTLYLNVPHFRGPASAWPGQHHHQFSIFSFRLLSMGSVYDVGNSKYKTMKLRHSYGPKLRILSPFANLHPLAWEWLGLPTSDIEWIGKKC